MASWRHGWKSLKNAPHSRDIKHQLFLTPCRQFQRRIENGNQERLLDASACLLPGKGTAYKQLACGLYQAVGKSINASFPTDGMRHGHSSLDATN